MSEKNSNIGALWEHADKNSNVYFSGFIKDGDTELNIIIFPNLNKKSQKHPDYNVLKSKRS